MLFNSVHFLVFLPCVTLLYFVLPFRWRPCFLLAASYYFYGVFSVRLSLLLVATTLLDYTAARIIGGADRRAVRRAALIISLTGNLGLLALFKYLDFVDTSLGLLLGAPPWPLLYLVLPLGISFYTFESMSYTIDVYRGIRRPERSLVTYALFIAFFPHLVAGPIMRAGDLLPQFTERHRANAERILSGVLLCGWGLLKKIFLADPMGRIVEAVYGSQAVPLSPDAFSGWTLLLATYAFAIQIYCDFSAYSDIARGAGRILGFRIMRNFDAPYLAVSITDFWRRWHISLSTWLRDYLYIPLGGNKRGAARTYVNLLLTMLLGGLWHGANWTFVVWGALHGGYLAVERALGFNRLDAGRISPLRRWSCRLLMFHLVCLGWVFFRAPTIGQALHILRRIVTWAAGPFPVSQWPAIMLMALLIVQALQLRARGHALVLRFPSASRWIGYAVAGLLVMVFSTSRSPEFIYFQF